METIDAPTYPILFCSLETFLVEWKPVKTTETHGYDINLETFLVEWKRLRGILGPRAGCSLKPS